jgi:molybdenum cofactor guanylyltransferase
MSQHHILGVILAGGSGARFGGDKARALLADRPLIAHAAARAAPQVDRLMVNAREPFATLSFATLKDDRPGEGPLAGVLAALAHAEANAFTHVMSFACDTPFFPADAVARLARALNEGGDYAVARRGGDTHRVFALWPLACRARLADGFAGGVRSLRAVERVLTPVFVVFPTVGNGPGGDEFFNINTTDDLKAAEIWLSHQSH